jgi:predicted lipid carrier protein YhbT
MNDFTSALNPKEVLGKLSRAIKPVEKLASGGSRVLSMVPSSMQASTLTPVLNHALFELIDNGDLDFLEGHCCVISVRERNLAWHLCFDGNKLSVSNDTPADVTISATLPAFLNLISKQADPDTLFFQRQLSIEGDVELGLNVKNLLDALDEDDLPVVWQKALGALRQLISLETQK